MARLFVVAGAANAFLAVALGAFGAHGLRGRIAPELLAVFQTGVQYHMSHALGLVLVGILAQRLPHSPWLLWGGWFMLSGIVLFCVSLYALAITGTRGLGAITPFGGAAFLIAWALVVTAMAKQG